MSLYLCSSHTPDPLCQQDDTFFNLCPYSSVLIEQFYSYSTDQRQQDSAQKFRLTLDQWKRHRIEVDTLWLFTH